MHVGEAQIIYRFRQRFPPHAQSSQFRNSPDLSGVSRPQAAFHKIMSNPIMKSDLLNVPHNPSSWLRRLLDTPPVWKTIQRVRLIDAGAFGEVYEARISLMKETATD